MFTLCYQVSILTWKYETSEAPEADTSVTTDNDFKSLDKHNARQVPTICKTVKPPVYLMALLHCTCLQYRTPTFTEAWKADTRSLGPATHVQPADEGMPPPSCKDKEGHRRTDTRTHTDPYQGSRVTCGRTNIFQCLQYFLPSREKQDD